MRWLEVRRLRIPFGLPTISDPYWKALKFVLDREGGYSDHPADPGGPTNKGITLSTYQRWAAKHGLPKPDKEALKNIADEHLAAIYHDEYWLLSEANKLAWPNSLAVMDTAVLHGVGAAKKLWAEAKGNLYLFIANRLKSYTSMGGWPTFGAGWTNRVAALLTEVSK